MSEHPKKNDSEFADPQSETEHHHDLISIKGSILVFIGLLIGTALTVAAAQVDFGSTLVNFVIAMLIAVAKASLVVYFFMSFRHEVSFNKIYALGSLVFLAIFLSFCAVDWFTRGDYQDLYWSMHKKESPFPEMKALQAAQGSKFETPWVSNPELIEVGKKAFAVSCASCHGNGGMGDGVAAAGLNPKPRNLTSKDNWKGERKFYHIYDVIMKGLPGTQMSSFAALPMDERFGIAHYILTLGGLAVEKDTNADLAKIGIDPSKPKGGLSESRKEIPIQLAIEAIAVD